MRKLPTDRARAVQGPQDHAHDERAGGGTELEDEPTGQGDEQGPQSQSESGAESQRQGIDLGDVRLGVTEEVGGVIDPPRRDDAQHAVPGLEDGVVTGQHVEIPATYPGHPAVRAPQDVDVTESSADQRRVRDEESAKVDLLPVVGETSCGDMAQVRHGPGDVVGIAHDEHLVARVQVLVGGDEGHLTLVQQVRHLDLTVLVSRGRTHRRRTVHDGGHGSDAGIGHRRVVLGGGPLPAGDEGHHDHGDDDTGGIRQGIADEGVAGTVGRRRRGVDRRRGEGPGVQPGDVSVRQTTQRTDPQRRCRHGDEPDDAGDHERPLAFEVRQEGRSRSQPHRVAEQHHTQALDHAEPLPQTWIQRPDGQPHEEGTSGAEPQRSELDLPEQGPQGEHHQDREDLMGCEEIECHGHDCPPAVSWESASRCVSLPAAMSIASQMTPTKIAMR